MGFEPMQLALAGLESASLDHSDTDERGASVEFRSRYLSLTKRVLYQVSYRSGALCEA